MLEHEILRETMTDRGDFFRQIWDGEGYQTAQIYTALPCALSRGSHMAAPRLRSALAGAAESGFRMMLYLPKGTRLLAGDRAEILREGQKYRGICSASLGYESFALAAVEIQEVTEA